MPDREKLAVQCDPVCMDAFSRASPIQFRREKSLLGGGIGNTFAPRRILELGELGEFIPAPLTNKLRKFGLEVAKEREWLIRTELLPHEDHGDLRKQ